MAKGKAAAAAEEETTEVESTETDYTAYADKPITELHQHLADWIVEKTGLKFATKKEQDAFTRGVSMGAFLRMKHQASPENQERLEALDEVREARAAEKAERKAEKAAKATTEETEETPAPAKKAPAKKTGGKVVEAAAKVNPAKKAPAKKAKPASGDAPF